MAEHSVFGATVPTVLTTFNDAEQDSWLSTQFYVPVGGVTGLSLVGMRIYLPVGSGFIGRPGYFALMRRALADGGIWTAGANLGLDFDTNGTRVLVDPLVAGWNDVHFVTPFPMNPGDGIVVGYRVGGGNWYLYDTNGTIATSSIRDIDNIGFYMAETGVSPGQVGRSNYRGNWTAATWYGIDVIVSDGGTPNPAQGSFGGEYGWRPAEFGGASSRSGSFGGTYGWGEAQFSGATAVGGGFLSTYGWGPASWVGVASRLGTFGGQYGWGPATMAGEVTTGGDFGGQYGWGPAVFTGFGNVPDNFPVCDFDLILTAPSLTLEIDGPELTLEASC